MGEEEAVVRRATVMGAGFFFLVPLVAVVFDEPDLEPGGTRAVSLLILHQRRSDAVRVGGGEFPFAAKGLDRRRPGARRFGRGRYSL